jgi:hypothetical protein
VSARFAWIGRVRRGRRLDRNPLRRRSDRVETVILAALLAAFLGGAPLAAHAAATWISATSQQELRAQQATYRQVTAVLLDAAVTVPGYGGGYSPAQATAQWRAPDGAVRTGLIATPAGAKAGRTVRIWTNLSGELVTPLQQDQIASRADLAAMAAVAALGIVLLTAAVAVRRALDRRRMTAWEAEWLATGPRWSSRAGPQTDI